MIPISSILSTLDKLTDIYNKITGSKKKLIFVSLADWKKIKDVLKFIKENQELTIQKFEAKNNKKIYNELLDTLWNYINKNNYYSFYKKDNNILNKKIY